MSRFATITLSDPLHETSYLRYLTLKSPALRGRGDITLFVPPGVEESPGAALVLLLHGVYGSHWDWTQQGRAHQTAMRMIAAGEIAPLVLAMPSDGLWGDGTMYLRHAHADYEAWIVKDVIDAVREVLPAVTESSPTYISGLSMGGYGALRLAAKNPRRFQGCSAHSSMTDFRQMERFTKQDLSTYDLKIDDDGSVLYWMLHNASLLPPTRFDCGTEDPLLPHNRDLHEALSRHDIPHAYQEFDGGHSWAYWQLHLAETLRFLDVLTKGTAAPIR